MPRPAALIPGSQYAGPLTGETITALTNTFRPDIDAYLGAEQDNFKETMSDHLYDTTIVRLEALRKDPEYANYDGAQELESDAWAKEQRESYRERLNLFTDEYGRLVGLDENGNPLISDESVNLAPGEINADSPIGGN